MTRVNSTDATPRLDRAEADVLAARFVAGLHARGVGAGERVAFSASNSPELLAAVFGCLRAGIAPIVLSSKLTAYERDSMLADVTPALVVDDETCRSLTASELDALDTPALDARFHCRPLHFTSGTTGRPKAVWSGWHDETASEGVWQDELGAWGFSAADEHWVCSPLSHSAPLRFAVFTLLAGGAVRIPVDFDAAEVRKGLEGGVSTTFMAPTQLQRVLDGGPVVAERLRLLAHAGSECPEQLKRSAIDAFGASVVVEFYGSTEGQFTVCPASEWLARPGTVGRARPGRRMKVVDGQLWCEPPDFARFEYWGDPAKTAAVWDGSWFTVGDLGRIDHEGYVYLEGRRSDLIIITGGVNVYPAEVERILRELDGVTDICIVGLDDVQWGQRVCAVITGDVTTAQLEAYAKEHLAPYKRPKTIRRVDAMPLTHSGKIDRQAVAASLAEDG
ncbi:class I adenylate-forming enzyme family protein [Aeromicrobium panaciterrae]|uniref:class I adenylate-forming enzyme family protein n=1 Tax=Aeromicrobium panaciterrae TaxID=363861 RepID=UPI0031E44AE2